MSVDEDDSDRGWGVSLGYDFNDYVGVEIGYKNFGEAILSFTTTLSATTTLPTNTIIPRHHLILGMMELIIIWWVDIHLQKMSVHS